MRARVDCRHTPPPLGRLVFEGRKDMTDIASIKREMAEFSEAFDYDASYMVDLAEASLGAYQAFAAAQALGQCRAALPLDAHAVAGISTTMAEDCGECAQLGLRMAVQRGVDRALLRLLIEAPSELPAPLADVRDHARAVCAGEPDDPARAARLHAVYGDAGVAELAVCITGARIYPTLKRALSRSALCRKLTLDF
jgi:hypothetical protein